MDNEFDPTTEHAFNAPGRMIFLPGGREVQAFVSDDSENIGLVFVRPSFTDEEKAAGSTHKTYLRLSREAAQATIELLLEAHYRG